MYLMDGPPFRASASEPHVAHDRRGEPVGLTAGSRHALRRLTSPAWRGTEIAVVSRTYYPEWAGECLRLLRFRHGSSGELVACDAVIDHRQIYPGGKKTHFRKIHAESGVPFDRMVFFDNEMRNVRDVQALGVHSFYTPDGQTVDAWQQMLDHFDLQDEDDGNNNDDNDDDDDADDDSQ